MFGTSIKSLVYKAIEDKIALAQKEYDEEEKILIAKLEEDKKSLAQDKVRRVFFTQ